MARETKKSARLGAKVRTLRRRAGLTQAQLAKKLEISASYLNLIEHDKRPLTASLLIALAQEFEVDLQVFSASEEAQLSSDLMEALGDPLFEDEGLTNTDVQELVTAAPAAARALLRLYQDYRGVKESAQSLATKLAAGDDAESLGVGRMLLPSEEVSDLLQRRGNYFKDLEDAAEAVRAEARITPETAHDAMCAYLDRVHGIRVEVVRGRNGMSGALRRFDPQKKLLLISEHLPVWSRSFQLAHQIALVAHHQLLEEMTGARELTTEESQALGRVALANYFAGAVLMPYEPFLDAARDVRFDVELLSHRFRTSFEQVCHRLTTMHAPGNEGVPFHFIRVDIAGNISKRYSGSGIRFARFSGACPRWNVFAAFLTPGAIRTQVSSMPDGTTYFCIARTVRSTSGGYGSPVATYAVGLGCEVGHASELVYADGIDLSRDDLAIPVGVSCRLCERMDCPQRALPPLSSPLEVDENVRGLSFYAPAMARQGS